MARREDTAPGHFAVLKAARRVWAVAAVHGEAARLDRLHALIWERLRDGDGLVYTGNILGRGEDPAGALDRAILFRRAVIARPRAIVEDVAFLRGAQEEMWSKLLQLQFAPNPREVLDWMLANGMAATLAAYGGDEAEGRDAARKGVMALTHWTQRLRGAQNARPGHSHLFAALRRAAYTDDGRLLFVNAGIDTARPLEAQADSFWWGGGRFGSMAEPYGGFLKVVRGYDPSHGGPARGPHAITLDGGCGFGGPLVAACIDAGGEVADWIEA